MLINVKNFVFPPIADILRLSERKKFRFGSIFVRISVGSWGLAARVRLSWRWGDKP